MRQRLRDGRRQTAVTLAGLGFSLMAFGLLSSTAQAASALRVGWWNTATLSGTAAPSPTTPAGGMRVAAGSGTAQTQVPGTIANPQVLAYGALLYELPEGSTATLVLKLARAAQGTPLVVACPTHSVAWPAGDDQPAPGPAYNCDSQHYPGTVSAAGDSVTFKLTAQYESTPGQLSIAIVPDLSNPALPTGGAPFAIDINPPDAAAFTPNQPPPDTSSQPEPYVAPLYNPPDLGIVGGPLGGVSLIPPPAAVLPVQPSARPHPGAGVVPPAGVTAATAESLQARIGMALGAVALVAAIMVWSLGFGLLGGRIIPLSVPLKHA
jgi:hypothetical protein